MRQRQRTVRAVWLAAGVALPWASVGWGAEYSVPLSFNNPKTGAAVSYTSKVYVDDSLAGQTVRGTIVAFDYGGGASVYNNTAWRNFAASKRLSLTLMPDQDSFGNSSLGLPSGYSYSTTLSTLNSVMSSAATQSGRTEWASTSLPIITTGVSRGGTAGAIATGWQAGASRTVASIAYHGNSFNYLQTSGAPLTAGASIPVLYPMAQLDSGPYRQTDIEAAVRTTAYVANLGSSYGFRPTNGFYWTTTMQYGSSHASIGDDTYPLQWLGRVWDARYNTTNGTLTAISNAASLKGIYTLSNGASSTASFTGLSTGAFTQKDGNIWIPTGGASDWLAESAAPGTNRDVDSTGNSVFTAPDSVISRNFTGAGSITFNGVGVVTMDNTGGTTANNFNMTGGTINLTGGATLRNGPNQGAVWTNNKASLSIDSASTFDLWDGNAVTVDSLNGSGKVTVGLNTGANWAGARTLTVGANGGTGSFSGVISGNGTTDGGTVSLVKSGNGTQTLSGPNTYTGTTTINAGSLNVTGSLAGNGSDKITLKTSSATLSANPSISRGRALGTSSAGFGATESGALNTAVQILAGTNSSGSDTSVVMQFRQRATTEIGPQAPGGTLFPNGGGLGSDVISLTGMVNNGSASGQTDKFVLQMSYNESELAKALGLTLTQFQSSETTLAASGLIQIGYLNASGAWAPAVSGNFGTEANPLTGFVGSWTSAGSTLVLGSYGVDVTTNQAWAVLNHNTQFAVVPEPGSGALLLTLTAAGLLRRRSPRSRPSEATN